MSINNDSITIAGNIGNDPTRGETRAGKSVINFRVATRSGYYDQRTGAWVENPSNWYAVAAYGNIADHAKASLHKGDPVIITGRLKVKEWEAGGKKGIDVEISADAIGHDLNWGTSAFVRRPRANAPQAAAPGGAAAAEGEDSGPTAAEQDAWGGAGMHVTDGLDQMVPEEDEAASAGEPAFA